MGAPPLAATAAGGGDRVETWRTSGLALPMTIVASAAGSPPVFADVQAAALRGAHDRIGFC